MGHLLIRNPSLAWQALLFFLDTNSIAKIVFKYSELMLQIFGIGQKIQ